MVMVMPVVVIILLIVISVVVVVIVAMVDFAIFGFLGRLWPCQVSLVPIDGLLGFMMIVPIVVSVVVVVIVAVPIVIAVMVAFYALGFLRRWWPCHVFLVPIDGFLSFMMIVPIVLSVVVGRIMRGINETVGLHYFHVPSGAVAMPTVAMSNSAQYVSQSDYRDAQNQQGSGAGYAPSKSRPETVPSIRVS